MWANAKRVSRPAEYTWHPLFNAGKFGWRPILECRAVRLPRRETRWNFAGVPQTNETISAVSGPKFTILWGHMDEVLLLNKFFPTVDKCLSCEDIARQIVRAMVPRWRFLTTFCGLYLQRAPCSTFQTCILNSLRPHHVCKYGRHPICDGWD